MENFKDFKHLEDKLIGSITLSQIGEVWVEFDLEDHYIADDLNKLMAQAALWLQSFNENILQELKKAIAAELTDAAYSGTAYQPVSSDYINLERSLKLIKICFYQDADTSLIFESETEYPDMNIYCLLDESFLIADLFVDGK